MPKTINLIGRRFGKLEVVRAGEKLKGVKHLMWLCRCDCGAPYWARGKSLLAGKTVGCRKRECQRPRNVSGVPEAGTIRERSFYLPPKTLQENAKKADQALRLSGGYFSENATERKRVTRPDGTIDLVIFSSPPPMPADYRDA